MKKKIFVLFAVLLSMTLQAASPWDGTTIAASYAAGSGTSGDPYRIGTPAELAFLSQSVNGGNIYNGKYFILTSDLDLNGKSWTPIGSANSFRGTFDGKSHLISNLNVNVTTSTAGLFGNVQDAIIKNLGIVGTSTVTGVGNVGGIVGQFTAFSASGFGISGCFSNATVSSGSGSNAGGIVGQFYFTGAVSSLITNCYSTGNISGNSYVAGIVGRVAIKSGVTGTLLTISNSYATGTITANSLSSGIAKSTGTLTETNCYYIYGSNVTGSTAKTAVQMQDPAFVTSLNDIQSPAPWIADWTGGNINSGYPILKPALSTSAATATAFTTTYGTASAAQTFSVSGSYLGVDIVAYAPPGFQVSSNGSSYSNTATFTKSGSSASGTVYIRLKANATVSGTYDSQTISIVSTGSTSAYIHTSATGNAVTAKALTITAGNQTVPYGTDPTAVTGAGTYTPTGFITGENASVISGSASYSTTYTNTTSVGTSGVTITPIVTGLTAANYSFTPVDGTVTVTQATPTLSLASSSVNYNGLSQAATVNGSISGSVSNIKYDGSSTAPTVVGSYAVTADFAPTDGTNYASLTGAAAGSFTINATVPDAPIVGTATAGNTQVSVAFTAPSNNGGSSIIDYTVTPYIGTSAGTQVTGSVSPIVVTGLTNGTAYTFTVTARNTVGSSASSSASNSVKPAPASVTVSSDSNLSSYFPSSATDVTVSSGYELTVDANLDVKSMTVNPGGKLTLASNLTVAGAITLQSDASGTATLKVNSGTLTAATTNVQQHLSDIRNWYLSSPITNATAPEGNTYFKYDETGSNSSAVSPATAYWVAVNSGAAFEQGRGYIALPGSIASPFTFTTSTGSLNNGNVTVDLTRQGATKTGFNLVGNPYPSHITLSKAITDASNVLNTIWYRTSTGYNATTHKYDYAFYTCLINDGTYISSPLNSGATPIVAPMQAFWVRLNSGTIGTFTFTNAIRSHQSSNLLKAPAVQSTNQEMLRLQVTNGTNTDEAVVYFNANASNSFDSYDAPKMTNGSSTIPEIYSLVGTEQLVINGMNAIPYDTEMPIGFTTGTAGNFSLKASQFANFDAGTKVILKDYSDVNNPVITDLSDGSSYSFSSVATSNNTSRFTLTFRAPSVATGINPESNDNVWISTRNGQLVVDGLTNGATLEVFNSVGQKLILKNLTGKVIEHYNILPAGAYLVKVTNEGKSITRKIIIN